jgi:hypothetical protein
VEPALPNMFRHWSKESRLISNAGAEVGGGLNSKVWNRFTGTYAIAIGY